MIVGERIPKASGKDVLATGRNLMRKPATDALPFLDRLRRNKPDQWLA